MASANFVSSCYQDSEPPTLDTSALIFHAALHPAVVFTPCHYTTRCVCSSRVTAAVVGFNRRLISPKGLWLLNKN